MITKFEDVEAVYQKALNGNADAQFEIGKLFSEGKIIKQNFESAFFWLSKACKQNHAKAFQYLGNCYLCGEGVPADAEKAMECYKRSGELGCGGGFYNLGFAYYNGMGSKVDCDKAVFYLDKAGKMGEPDGFTGAGIVCLHRGDGKNDPIKAIEYFVQALSMNENDSKALFKMGEMFAYGIVVEKDLNKARLYFHKSASLGDENALKALASLDNGNIN